jgi:CheY-like chemotaxis protein
MNLITNASEAIGDRDGVIRVTTSQLTVGGSSAFSAAELLAEGDYLLLAVSDTGVGMTPEMQARIFDPFYTTKLAGHGLGLAVVHGIVRNLGGSIRLRSAPGEGTTFEILLPCAEEVVQSASGTIARVEDEGIGSPEATILYVEDEAVLRQATAEMLRKIGYSVLEAHDGTTAVRLIREQQDHIDLLLLDVSLPGATSCEVLEEARRRRPGLRVIITSANSEEMAAASLKRKVERFVRKPYRLGVIIDMLRDALSS